MIILIIEHKDGRNEMIDNLYGISLYTDRIVTWIYSDQNDEGIDLGNIYDIRDIKEYIISNSLED